MEYTQNSTLQEKKTLLFLLVKLAEADNVFKTSEDKFIKNVAYRMKLTDEDIDAIRFHSDDFKPVYPKTEDERMVYFYHLLFLMQVDDDIAEEEKKLLRHIGFHLGINPTMIEDLIEVMGKFMHSKLPDGELIRTVRKYLN